MSTTSYYIERDSVGQPIPPVVVLAHRNGTKIGVLNIEENTLIIKLMLEDSIILSSEMSCDMHKYINTYKNPLWDQVKNFALVMIPINIPHIQTRALWYEIEIQIDETDETVKHLTGTLFQQAELSNVSNYEVEIRTQADMERDDYEDTIFYNPTNPKASIVHRVLNDKANHYSIYHVDDSLKNVKRTFQFNGVSVFNCLKQIGEEVDCMIVFGESEGTDIDIHRTISFYDKKDYCPACGKRGDFENGCTNPECNHNATIVPRYGEDTGIFINRENLGEDISLTINADTIINCYRLTAGDDIMTTAVILCNPSGSRYLWAFTDDMKQDMSEELRNKINQYEILYNTYKYNYQMSGVSSTSITDYNNLVTKYQSYSEETLNNISDPIRGYSNLTLAYYDATYLKDFLSTIMMPYSEDVEDTTAEQEMAKFNLTTIGVRNLTGITAASSVTEIEDTMKLYVDDSRYRIDIVTTSYSKPTWRGEITLTSYTDEEDIATATRTLTFSEATGDYIKNEIEKFIKKREAMVSGIKVLYDLSLADYTNEIKKYNLDYLTNLLSVVDAVLAIMDDAGITQSSDPDVYQELYQPLFQKRQATGTELELREQEVEKLNTLVEEIESQMTSVNDILDLEDYVGNSLWLELLAFRRENVYENGNYISDGLNNAELIQNAKEFFDRADEEIAKNAESQYSISTDLKNLLVLLPEEYNQRLYQFDLGNWMRIEVDEKIYKLQLISYEIEFDDLSHINVEFSEAKSSNNIISTIIKTSNELKKGITDISQTVKNIKKVDEPISIEITSSKGLLFKKNQVDTILTCQVKRGNTDITDSISEFKWVKYDKYGVLDEEWSRGNINSITITSSDVNEKAIFRCDVTLKQ